MEAQREQTTTICISRKNRDLLILLGKKGDSFDDILTQILDRIKPLQVTIESGQLSDPPVMEESTQTDIAKEQLRADV